MGKSKKLKLYWRAFVALNPIFIIISKTGVQNISSDSSSWPSQLHDIRSWAIFPAPVLTPDKEPLSSRLLDSL